MKVGLGLNFYGPKILNNLKNTAGFLLEEYPLEGTAERILFSFIDQLNNSIISIMDPNNILNEMVWIEKHSYLIHKIIETDVNGKMLRGKVLGYDEKEVKRYRGRLGVGRPHPAAQHGARRGHKRCHQQHEHPPNRATDRIPKAGRRLQLRPQAQRRRVCARRRFGPVLPLPVQSVKTVPFFSRDLLQAIFSVPLFLNQLVSEYNH